MVVSKQAYTVSAPWLNFNLADQFRLAFIDAGLMDDWYDSFETGSGSTSGERNQHRVIRIIYDANKKYGTVFHWFTFRPNGKHGLRLYPSVGPGGSCSSWSFQEGALGYDVWASYSLTVYLPAQAEFLLRKYYRQLQH
jgi:hypothetical protein